MDFSLGDMTTGGRDDVFDRLLEGDDMVAPVEIDFLHKRREGCCLTAPHRACHKNQTILILGEEFQLRRHLQLVECPERVVNNAERQIVTETLTHYAGPVTAILIGVGKIDISHLQQPLHL